MLKTDFFGCILLKQMDQVQLMNRTDRKYWFNREKLQPILNEVADDYFILEVENDNQIRYATRYFDTSNNEMFISHHNGKLNRYKIRKRTYEQSGCSFLEVKFKTNKGRTLKKRIPTETPSGINSLDEIDFLKTNSPYQISKLHEVLVNHFTRITLVNKNLRERCTIDFDLSFESDEQEAALGDLAIVEVKTDNSDKLTPIEIAMRNHNIKSSGFSKYCVGCLLTKKGLKKNAFKEKLRKIEKEVPQLHIAY